MGVYTHMLTCEDTAISGTPNNSNIPSSVLALGCLPLVLVRLCSRTHVEECLRRLFVHTSISLLAVELLDCSRARTHTHTHTPTHTYHVQ